MPNKAGKFSPQERKFVKELALIGEPVRAAASAGYRAPSVSAHQLAQRPSVQAAVVAEQNAILHNELLPLALRTIRSVLENEKAPAAARIQASKLVLDRTLGAGEKLEKEPHEMTAAELASKIEELERRAADLAKPVDQAPAAISDGGIFD